MVEVQDLKKTIGNQEVLKGVTLKLKDHERRALIGLIEPDGGRIYLDREDITDLTPKECNDGCEQR